MTDWLNECIVMHVRDFKRIVYFLCQFRRNHLLWRWWSFAAHLCTQLMSLRWFFLSGKNSFNLFDVQRWLVVINNSWILKTHSRTFTQPFWAHINHLINWNNNTVTTNNMGEEWVWLHSCGILLFLYTKCGVCVFWFFSSWKLHAWPHVGDWYAI